ncbi:MAG: EAL domain-containing protein [Pseudomonadota bacterium]
MRIFQWILLPLFAGALIAAGPANEQQAWVKEALLLGEEQRADAFSIDSAAWDAHERRIEALEPLQRIRRSLELSFIYINGAHVDRYEAFADRQQEVFEQYATPEQVKASLMMRAYAQLGRHDDYAKALKELKKIQNTQDLGPSNTFMMYVMRAYLEVDLDDTSAALRSLQAAEMIQENFAPTDFMLHTKHGARAYVLMEAGDFAGSVKSYRAKGMIKSDFARPRDTASNISNVSWMLGEVGQVEEAVKLNQLLVEKLHDQLNPSHRFYTLMACGNLRTRSGEYDEAIRCFERSKLFLSGLPKREVIWQANMANTMARAGRIAEARGYLNSLKTHPEFDQSPESYEKVRIAQSLVDLEDGNPSQAVKSLISLADDLDQSFATERHTVIASHRELIDNETENLRKNALLQEELLYRQTLFTALAIAVAVLLCVFLSVMWTKHRKERELSITDPLTGLYNRRGFDEKLRALYGESSNHRATLALGIVDLDGFKAVNDLHGHAVGDAVLVLVAERMRECLGKDALLGRLGGDEFAFATQNFADKDALRDLALKLRAEITQDHKFGDALIAPRASIGLAIPHPNDANLNSLYDRADFALYTNKSQSIPDIKIFDDDHYDAFNKQRELEATLADAEPAEFELLYQPIIDMRTSQTQGFEALARWHSPTLGQIGPDQFIPLAERLARIRPLTIAFLKSALEEAKTWPDHLNLSFNLSSHDLSSVFYAQRIRDVILQSSFEPRRVILEITETAMVQDTDRTREALEVLDGLGIRIALDDYGTGFSSLDHLTSFAIDRIKVDKGLTQGIVDNPSQRSIVDMLVKLSRDLGIECVIEGVENEEQLLLIELMNAQMVQGYLFAKPLGRDELSSYLADQDALAPDLAEKQPVKAKQTAKKRA